MKIKNINVEMTYKVSLSNIEVTEMVYNGLEKIEEMGEISDDEANLIKDREILEAYDWLMSNIQEADAYSWQYEIDVED